MKPWHTTVAAIVIYGALAGLAWIIGAGLGHLLGWGN